MTRFNPLYQPISRPRLLKTTSVVQTLAQALDSSALSGHLAVNGDPSPINPGMRI